VLATLPSVAADVPVAHWKRELEAGRRALETAFRAHRRAERLLGGQARLTDRILRGLWAEVGPPPGSALVAVGGYGRGKLFPTPTSMSWCFFRVRSRKSPPGTQARSSVSSA